MDPRKIEVMEIDLVEVENEGLRPDHGYDKGEESDDTDDDAHSQSGPGERMPRMCIKYILNIRGST